MDVFRKVRAKILLSFLRLVVNYKLNSVLLVVFSVPSALQRHLLGKSLLSILYWWSLCEPERLSRYVLPQPGEKVWDRLFH